MASFIFEVFLLTQASVPRIVSALLANGFTVQPWVEKDGLTISNPGAPSVILSVKLTHTKQDQREVYNQVIALLKNLEVPFYGAVLKTTGDRSLLSPGFFPPTKKQPAPIPAGPYRTFGSVIPFPEKDDGIIDDTHKD